jgi:hypothetical protein
MRRIIFRRKGKGRRILKGWGRRSGARRFEITWNMARSKSKSRLIERLIINVFSIFIFLGNEQHPKLMLVPFIQVLRIGW